MPFITDLSLHLRILNNIIFKFDTYIKTKYRPQFAVEKSDFMKKCSKIYIHEASGISRQI